jgi:hypothetical protein
MANSKIAPFLRLLTERLLECLERFPVPIEDIAIAQEYGYPDEAGQMPAVGRTRERRYDGIA